MVDMHYRHKMIETKENRRERTFTTRAMRGTDKITEMVTYNQSKTYMKSNVHFNKFQIEWLYTCSSPY